MDNYKVHKTEVVRELVEEAGFRTLFLPPYSPELSTQELVWSKVKGSMRKAAAKTVDGLWDAFSFAYEKITSSDALGWFSHCGYMSPSK